MVFGALREKSMNVPVGGCLKQNMASRREKQREGSEGWARVKRVKLDVK